MREIKFRAWDKINKKMLYYFGYGKEYMVGGKGIDINELIKSEQAHGLIMLEYTGLKDINGKEICEGDILEMDGGAKPFNTHVFFEYGCFCIRMNQSSPELKYYIDMEFVEAKIIGNIYENPELLKATK